MPKLDASRFLGGYAAVMTALAGWALLGGGATNADTLDVHRINIREDDGTLRMVIAGRDHIGGIVVAGREYPHPDRREAGMVFYNDEGTENGGLVFDGGVRKGKPTNSGSLTFDRWRQDQTIQMHSREDGDRRTAAFVIYDRPVGPMRLDDLARIRSLPAGQTQAAALREANIAGIERIHLGRQPDSSAELALRDAAGRPRLVLRVAADGKAAMRFLDEAGRTVKTTTRLD